MIADLIKHIVESICEFPDKVNIKEIPGDTASLIEIHVEKADQGKIIGKGGKVIQSIRNIIYSASYKVNKRYTIEVIGHQS